MASMDSDKDTVVAEKLYGCVRKYLLDAIKMEGMKSLVMDDYTV
jgi:hypothetical protein